MVNENPIDKELVELLAKRVKLLEERREDLPWEFEEKLNGRLKPFEANLMKLIAERTNLLNTRVHNFEIILKSRVQDIEAQVRELQDRSDATLKICQKMHDQQSKMLDALSTIVTLMKRTGT
jgi:hypothetical protein